MGGALLIYSVGMADLALDDAESALRLMAPSDLRNRAVVLTLKAGIYRDQGRLAGALALPIRPWFFADRPGT